MSEEKLRRTMAAAIRTVLEEGLRKTDDPIAYLHSAAAEVRQLVELFEGSGAANRVDGAAIRILLVEEVEAATQELLRRLHH